MITPIPKLLAVERKPVKTVVEVLEKALVDAKSGELRSVAVVGDCGVTYYHDAGWEDYGILLGLLARQMHRINLAKDMEAL